MKNEEFYIISETYTDFAKVISNNNERDVFICPKCEAVIVTRKNVMNVYLKGKKQGDYYRFSKWSVISRILQETFKNEQLTGYQIEPINFQGWFDKKGALISHDDNGLKELVVTGICGNLRDKDGKQIMKCIYCNIFDYNESKTVDGLSVDLDEWDGSDMFYFENWRGNIIVTQKVKEIIEKAKLKNIKFTNIKDFRFE